MEQEIEKRLERYDCLLNADDVAALLRISKRYAYHLMETGQIPNVRIGSSIRVFKADLLAYIDNLPRSGE